MAGIPETVYVGGALVYAGGDYIYAFSGYFRRNFWRYVYEITNKWQP